MAIRKNKKNEIKRISLYQILCENGSFDRGIFFVYFNRGRKQFLCNLPDAAGRIYLRHLGIYVTIKVLPVKNRGCAKIIG